MVFAVMLMVSLRYFLVRVSERLQLKNYKLEPKFPDDVGKRFKRVFREVFLQQKVLNRLFVGLMHALVMWGFFVFAFITLGHFWVGLNDLSATNPLVHGWYGDFTAVWAVLVIIGMLRLAYRRFKERPKELGDKLSVTSALITLAIIVLMLTYLLDWRFFAEHSLSSKINWWLHTVSLLAMLWIIPNSKHLHLFLAPLTIFLRSETMDTVRALDLENEDMGLINFKQLPWTDVLEVNSCVECGRCTMACPVNLAGDTLNPKSIVLNMQKGLLHNGEMIAGTSEEIQSGKAWVSETDLFQCLSCGACSQACPVGIQPVGKIMELRRGLVSEGRTNNEKVAKLFSVMERAPHNRWGISSETRKKFIEKENFPIFDGSQEWLFWLGCGNSYDPHGQEVAKAMKKIFLESGTSWGVLLNEVCCGEPVRKTGNELAFLTLSEKVNELFANHKVKNIITCCPHCATMFEKDYRQLPDYQKLDIKVFHHTEFIWLVLPALSLNKNPKTVTYHDPCYLARGRQVINEPREILEFCGHEIKEPKRCKSETSCCGAGGAQIDIADDKKDHGKERVNRMRFEELESTEAEILAVACSYCHTMMKDAGDLETLDIAEIVAGQLIPNRKEVQ